MPTVVKTFHFDLAEGWADGGNSSVLTYSQETGDGSPGSPCGKVTQGSGLSMASATEYCRTQAGETWEVWGVPHGATVTSVRVTSWRSRLVAYTNTGIAALTHTGRIVDGSNATVLSGDLFSNLNLTTEGSFTSHGPETSRNVSLGNQPSSSAVKFEVQQDAGETFGGTLSGLDQRYDEIVLEITYTAGVDNCGQGFASNSPRAAIRQPVSPLHAFRASVPPFCDTQFYPFRWTKTRVVKASHDAKAKGWVRLWRPLWQPVAGITQRFSNRFLMVIAAPPARRGGTAKRRPHLVTGVTRDTIVILAAAVRADVLAAGVVGDVLGGATRADVLAAQVKD